jgi:hypothetical protein
VSNDSSALRSQGSVRRIAAAHVPPNARWRTAWLLLPVLVVVALTAGAWTHKFQPSMLNPAIAILLNGAVACPHAGILMWSAFGRRRFRRGGVDLRELPEAPWILRAEHAEFGVVTPAGVGASLILELPLKNVRESPGILRLQCRHAADGLALLANVAVIVQLLGILVIGGYTLYVRELSYLGFFVLLAMPFIGVYTLILLVQLASAPSPWSLIEISQEGSRWLVPQSFRPDRDLRPADILDMAAVDGGLKLKVRRQESADTEDVLVALPGGSLPAGAQAAMAMRAFRMQVLESAKKKAAE